eukprot:768645-Hanusia_phi.AAC.2
MVLILTPLLSTNSNPALTISSSWNPNTIIYIVNNGSIFGSGGAGGTGGAGGSGGIYTSGQPGRAGGNGGTAIIIPSITTASLTIYNAGTICGGGGGGGGGSGGKSGPSYIPSSTWIFSEEIYTLTGTAILDSAIVVRDGNGPSSSIGGSGGSGGVGGAGAGALVTNPTAGSNGNSGSTLNGYNSSSTGNTGSTGGSGGNYGQSGIVGGTDTTNAVVGSGGLAGADQSVTIHTDTIHVKMWGAGGGNGARNAHRPCYFYIIQFCSYWWCV